MIDNIINDKPEQAQVVFHNYLAQKMREKMSSGGDAEDVLPLKDLNNEE
jgi:hypothetical protein